MVILIYTTWVTSKGIDFSMKVGVFILNYMRPDTTPKVVDSVLHQTHSPDTVYVWNNNPETTIDYSGCVNINSQENFRCIMRHAVALAKYQIDYWLFIDDDVVLKPGAIENFISYNKKYPEAILGYYGRDIPKGGLYSLDKSNWFTNVNKERETDLIMGMVHFCHRNKLANSFQLKKLIPNMPMTEDDIILSLSNRFLDNAKNYVIPHNNENGPVPLSSKHTGGLSMSGGHFGRRKNAVRTILEWAGEKVPERKSLPKQKGFKEI